MGHKIAAFLLLMLAACSEVEHKYRDTSELEMPPRLDISEPAPRRQASEEQYRLTKGLGDSVSLDDAEAPPVLKIKKLFDRSWNIVGQALDLKKIEVTDKNREQGVYYVKYDPSEDSGTRVFGNVTLFIFEEEYEEAEYKLSIVWRETECEVRATKVEPTENGDEDEALGDGSAKLIEALYEAIRDELSE